LAERLTYTDIAPYVMAGRQNQIVLRVEPGERGGGLLLGPVAIRDVEPSMRIYFDLSNQQQAEIFMRELHGPLMQEGVDFWWVDGGSGAVDMPGLNKQLWTNKVFFDYMQQQTGRRGFILGRYGDWGSERYPRSLPVTRIRSGQYSPTRFAFTARGGNVLVPYISHDIGGFHGKKIDFDCMRAGSSSAAQRAPADAQRSRQPREGKPAHALDLRRSGRRVDEEVLHLAHATDSLPVYVRMLRTVSLSQYCGRCTSSTRSSKRLTAIRTNTSSETRCWSLRCTIERRSDHLSSTGSVDRFLQRQALRGGGTFTAHYAVDETPVFVREGALVPEQGVSDYSNAKPLDTLILNVYGSGQGSFDLYEDDGFRLPTTRKSTL